MRSHAHAGGSACTQQIVALRDGVKVLETWGGELLDLPPFDQWHKGGLRNKVNIGT